MLGPLSVFSVQVTSKIRSKKPAAEPPHLRTLQTLDLNEKKLHSSDL